jgi:hypothetical protein
MEEIKMKKMFLISAIIASVTLVCLPAGATVMIFQDSSGNNLGNDGDGYTRIPGDYGSYASGPVVGTYAYGAGTHGWTGDIEVALLSKDSAGNVPLVIWPGAGQAGGAGDLAASVYVWTNDPAGYSAATDPIFHFKGHNGKGAVLYSLEVAGWGAYSGLPWDVKDKEGNVLQSGTVDVPVTGHATVTFDPAQCFNCDMTFHLYVDAISGETNMAFDDFEFGEAANPPCAALKCGDPGYAPPAMDLNGDCHVDFKDLWIFVQNWMKCTDPNPPCNYLP